ncbi:MAG: cell division protein FtsQ [Solirubrobacteraceae bacterium]|jgi:cell division protein FtsQ|nr:cell division protein FtsQ [Solirubrobacteraceae bacterium]
MDRSFAGRLGIGSLTRPPARRKARPNRAGPARQRANGRRARGSSGGHPLDVAIAHLLHAPSTLVRGFSGVWALVRARRRLRVAVLACIVALPLLGGGWLWLRHSSLVAVQHVRVSGVHGSEAQAIEAALTGAAKRMSTLDVSTSKLRAAVASYPVVGDVRVHTSFPHGLSIEVIEQSPVATLTAGGVKTAVAANGVVLGEAHASSSLPTLTSQVQLTPGEHVRETALLGELTVLGAAPKALARATERAYSGSKGLTLVMHSGLRAYFGGSSRPHAKWTALVRVLADPGSAGASYVDVRVPERPAAGFPAGVTPPAVAGAEGEAAATSASGESEQSLAEKLSSAVGGSASTQQAGNSEEEASSSSEAGTSESESSSSAESESSGETSSSSSTESSG